MPEPSIEQRLAARHPPRGLPAGYQEWRRLLFVHWALPPEVLRPLVPPPLSLDLYQGAAYVSLLPFFVQAARPLGAPRRLGLAFLETNVRTYVHLEGAEPAIYFLSLDAASALAVLGARLSLGLPYFLARGQSRGPRYHLQRVGPRRAACEATCQAGEPLPAAQPGSLDFFLIERYLAHVRRGPSLWTIQVHHPPYPLHAVRAWELRESLLAADGVPPPQRKPLVHFSPGVDVAIFPPRIRVTA